MITQPSWCRKYSQAIVTKPTITEFEQQVKKLHLRSEASVLNSYALREWVRQNFRRRYVPEGVLAAMGINADLYFENLESLKI